MCYSLWYIAAKMLPTRGRQHRPSIAVFCSESVECFPGISSKFFFNFLVPIPVAPIITGMIVHYYYYYLSHDRLCGLVVRVSGYRYRGLGFVSRRYQIF